MKPMPLMMKLMKLTTAGAVVVVAACEQTPVAPTSGTPAAAAPAAPGVVADTMLIAIVPDEPARTERLAGRTESVAVQARIDRTLSFPADFKHEIPNYVHIYRHTFPRPDITRDVLERGDVRPRYSLDGGTTWLTNISGVAFNMSVGYRLR